MFAKCKNCNIVRITRMRKTCPHCQSPLKRPTAEELSQIGENAMEQMQALRCLVDSQRSPEMALAGFMAIIHGRHLTENQAREMLS